MLRPTTTRKFQHILCPLGLPTLLNVCCAVCSGLGDQSFRPITTTLHTSERPRPTCSVKPPAVWCGRGRVGIVTSAKRLYLHKDRTSTTVRRAGSTMPSPDKTSQRSYGPPDKTSQRSYGPPDKTSQRSYGPPDADLTVHAAHITEVHNVPFKILLRPIPSVLDEDKVKSLINTLEDPSTADSVPPIDILWVKGRQGGDYYYSFGGCHRYEAHKRLQREFIPCKIFKSTVTDIRVYLGGSMPDLL